MGMMEIIAVGVGMLSVVVSWLRVGHTADALLSMLPILVVSSIIGGATLRDNQTGVWQQNARTGLLIAQSILLRSWLRRNN